MSISLHGIIFVMIFRCLVGVIRCWILSSCLNVLENSTQKCHFLRMCYKGMFGVTYCGIQSVGPLIVLYTSLRGIPVHSDTNSASPGSIQPCCNYCAKTSLTRVLRSTALCKTDNVVCGPYSGGALLHNYMTTVLICFNLQYTICRGPFEQQCIRYLSPTSLAADLYALILW